MHTYTRAYEESAALTSEVIVDLSNVSLSPQQSLQPVLSGWSWDYIETWCSRASQRAAKSAGLTKCAAKPCANDFLRSFS